MDGDNDGYVVKLNAAGSALDYATFLGGSALDGGTGIAMDGSGAVSVGGYTQSPDFPVTLGAFDTSFNGDSDAFVAKLNPAGSALAYATFLGGTDYDSVSEIAVDASRATYITGATRSSGFPTTPDAFDTSYNGNEDIFVGRLDPAGSALVYATFLGGSSRDLGQGIAVNGNGAAYVTGETESADFPITPYAFDPSFGGGFMIPTSFVAQLLTAYSISGRVTDAGNQGIPGVTISATGGYSTATDVSGVYTLTNVLSGTYTLTPTLATYRFEPVTCTVDVPPDATGQDFVGERLEFSSLYLPVVLRNQ
jgi:hypothetical protein